MKNRRELLIALGVVAGVAVGVALGFLLFRPSVSETERIVAGYPIDIPVGYKHTHKKMTSSTGVTPPSIQIELVQDPVKTRNYTLHIITANFRFAPAAVSMDPVYGEGHAHVYVDDYLISRAYSEWYHLPNLKPGIHTVLVTLNGNDHSEYVSGNIVVGASAAVEVK